MQARATLRSTARLALAFTWKLWLAFVAGNLILGVMTMGVDRAASIETFVVGETSASLGADGAQTVGFAIQISLLALDLLLQALIVFFAVHGVLSWHLGRRVGRRRLMLTFVVGRDHAEDTTITKEAADRVMLRTLQSIRVIALTITLRIVLPILVVSVAASSLSDVVPWERLSDWLSARMPDVFGMPAMEAMAEAWSSMPALMIAMASLIGLFLLVNLALAGTVGRRFGDLSLDLDPAT